MRRHTFTADALTEAQINRLWSTTTDPELADCCRVALGRGSPIHMIRQTAREAVAEALDAAGITYGAYLVYATPADLELECKTLRGAQACHARLVRAGFKPIIKRHATDGTCSWNEVVDLRA